MAAINTFSNPFGNLGGSGTVTAGGPAPAGPAPDPLGRAVDVYSALSQQEKLQQQIEMQRQEMQMKMMAAEGEKRASAYFMNNYDPETNEVNWGKWISDLASDPLTIKQAIQGYEFALKSGKTTAETLNLGLEAEKRRTDLVAQSAAALAETAATEGRNIRTGEASSQIADLVSRGAMTPEEGQAAVLNLPKEGPQLDAAVRKIAMEGELSGKAQDAVWGTVRQYDTGNALVTDRVGAGGQIETLQVMPKGMTPDQANEIVEIEGPNGEKIQITRAEAIRRSQGASGSATNASPEPGAPTIPGEISRGRTPRQVQEETAEVAREQKYAENVQTEGEQAQSNIGVVNLIEENLRGLETGGGGEYYLMAADLADAFGGSKELVDAIAGGSYDQARLVNSLNQLIAVQQFKEITGQPNRDLANQEFQRMVQAGVSLNNPVEANLKMITFYRGLQEIAATRSMAMNEWLSRGKDIKSFRKAWEKQERKLIKSGILSGTPMEDEE